MADREWTRELPAGYRAAEALRYLGRDGDSRCERVAGTSIVKAVRLAGQPALLSVEVGRCHAPSRAASSRGARGFCPRVGPRGAHSRGWSTRRRGSATWTGPFGVPFACRGNAIVWLTGR